MPSANRYLGSLVEYLDQGKLRPALVVREQGERVALLEPGGREKVINRDLILLRHSELQLTAAELSAAVANLESQRSRLATELDLNLLWEVVREQGRGFSAEELAELFFGERSTTATAVVLETLLNDRLYFTRRHLEFIAQSPEQVERLRTQYQKARLRSDSHRKTQSLIRDVFADHRVDPGADTAGLIEELRRFLENPSTRSKELTLMLSQMAPELAPAEVAFEILDRLGAAPDAPRFASIGGLKPRFSEQALSEAARARAPDRPLIEDVDSLTIDDEETREIDDALSCKALPDRSLRVRIQIALVADFVAKGSALDSEAADRAATVYLPEATVRMLPEALSCDSASLIAGSERPVLTTEVRLSPDGELLDCSIHPARIRVGHRLNYDQADRLLGEPAGENSLKNTLQRLNEMAARLRERRRRAGAVLFQRREAKVRVRGDQIEIKVIENRSLSRLMVAEFMVLSNSVAARFASDHHLPIIYRVQPGLGGDFLTQRPRLSLYPEFHAGIGLDFYAQVSSPIRRYADLVLQRQLVAALNNHGAAAYRTDELLTVLANAEAAEGEAKELERRAKRYWTLRYLQAHQVDRPLKAVALRDGASAELVDYAVRGTLRGVARAADETPITVRVARVDPLRGWLTLEYVGPASASDEISAG